MLRFERLPGKAKTPRIDGGNDKRSYQSRLVGPRFCFQGMKSPRFTGPGLHRNHIEWVDGRMSLWILYNGFTSWMDSMLRESLLWKKYLSTISYDFCLSWSKIVLQLYLATKRRWYGRRVSSDEWKNANFWPKCPIDHDRIIGKHVFAYIYPPWPCTNGMNASMPTQGESLGWMPMSFKTGKLTKRRGQRHEIGRWW